MLPVMKPFLARLWRSFSDPKSVRSCNAEVSLVPLQPFRLVLVLFFRKVHSLILQQILSTSLPGSVGVQFTGTNVEGITSTSSALPSDVRVS